MGQLGKRHGSILLGAGQCPHPPIPAIPRDNPRECAPWQKVHELGEKRLATVHRHLLGNLPKSARSSSNRHHGSWLRRFRPPPWAAYHHRLSALSNSQANHPPATPLPSQIPIAGQLPTSFPRVPSSEAFGRRPPPG